MFVCPLCVILLFVENAYFCSALYVLYCCFVETTLRFVSYLCVILCLLIKLLWLFSYLCVLLVSC